MFLLSLIVFFVLYLLCAILYYFDDNHTTDTLNTTSHNTPLEIFWTVMPSILLCFVAMPSFGLLYSIDELVSPSVTLKVIGHQWYWTYEYSDFSLSGDTIFVESYMLMDDDLLGGYFRLLETDTRVVLPIEVHVRALITSADVLHSWAVPSLGIKIDACPGRLNQVALFIKRAGIYYGQCSEICGVNHGFMPIVVQAVSLEKFNTWLLSKYDNIEGSWRSRLAINE